MSRGTEVTFSRREEALLRLASRRIRKLAGQLNEQERVHREMLIERDRLKSRIISLESEAAVVVRLADAAVADSSWQLDTHRASAPMEARLAWLRFAPQRARDAA